MARFINILLKVMGNIVVIIFWNVDGRKQNYFMNDYYYFVFHNDLWIAFGVPVLYLYTNLNKIGK